MNKTKFYEMILVAFSIGILAHATPQDGSETKPSLARVAETAMHRIQTLVISRPPKQIDVGYRDHFRKLTVSELQRQSIEEPLFYVLAEQVPCEDGSVNSVELWHNPDAKGASKWKHNVISTEKPAHNPPIWPIEMKDATTLIEPAIHLLLEKHEEKSDLKPYYEQLKSFEISQVVRDGVTLAEVHFEISDVAAPILTMWVTVDGVLQEPYALIPKTPDAK